MHNLCINDSFGQTQKWWINFLISMPHEVKDIRKELNKWGARIDFDRHGHGDTITFDKEENLVWFLLRWD